MLSHEASPKRHERDDFKLTCLIYDTQRFLGQGKPAQEHILLALQGLRQRSQRNEKIFRTWASRTEMMNPMELETFWQQVYFFSFANHGISIPEEPMPCLADMREMTLKEQMMPMDTDELLYPDSDETSDDSVLGEGRTGTRVDRLVEDSRKEEETAIPPFTPTQHEAMEYFNWQINKYGQYIPVTQWAKKKLQDRIEEEGISFGGNVYPVGRAACNCPHCWLYTEDVAYFMEHLWLHHAVSEDLADTNKSSEPCLVMAITPPKSKGDDEEVQDRKDSGYSDTMDIDQSIDMSPTQLTSALRSPPENIDPVLLAHGSDTAQSVDASAAPSSMDTTFWSRLFQGGVLESPIPHEWTSAIPQTSQRCALDMAAREAALRAKEVRDSLEEPMFSSPVWWKDILSMRKRRMRSRVAAEDDSKFSLQTKESSNGSERMPSDAYAHVDRHWVCAHSDECKDQFESLVLYMEHLAQHGFIVYHPAIRQLHQLANLTCMSLQAKQY